MHSILSLRRGLILQTVPVFYGKIAIKNRSNNKNGATYYTNNK